ncbi:MAG: hypothetical protein RBS80_12855 [Thermoguttaceae bacterium]|jgi:integrase|nr:hypothetical protein [Thermoguttaceae bacterium]
MASKTATPKHKKPRPDFPLFPHATGRWAKKVAGRTCYFGRIDDDPKGEKALEQWYKEKDDWRAGRRPRKRRRDGSGTMTVAEMCNSFLASTEQKMKTDGKLGPRTFEGYVQASKWLTKTFGRGTSVADLEPADFAHLRAKLAERLAAVSRRVMMTRIKHIFRESARNLWVSPPQYGTQFDPPDKKLINREKAKRPERQYSRQEVLAILGAVDTQMKAMVLLGVNCGFGNHDIGSLPLDALDLDGGWVEHPRPKNDIPRWAKLWPETVAALREYLATRPKPRHPADERIVFLTRFRVRWVRTLPSGGWHDSLSQTFGKLLRRLKLDRPGRNFYGLRHVCATAGGESRDPVAVDTVMGHVAPGQGKNYRPHMACPVSKERLQAVADAIHDWLFDTAGAESV